MLIDAVVALLARDVESAVEHGSLSGVGDRSLRAPAPTSRPSSMAGPADDDAATTDRFVRTEPGKSEPVRAARGTIAPATIATDQGERLASMVDALRAQAAACRRQAIALNAKLVLLEADRAWMETAREVHAVRERLIATAARLDHAVDEIDAVAAVEQQLADMG